MPAQYDAFISHVSEDKDSFVRPLAKGLRDRGLKIWYDEFELKVGMRVAASIDDGLAQSNYGVVVLSHHFFAKPWPRSELSALITRQTKEGRTIILPVWYEIDKESVEKHSPLLADTIAIRAEIGIIEVIRQLFEAISPEVETTPDVPRAKYKNAASFTVGANVYSVNGVSYVMPVAPYIIDGKFIVPARFLGRALSINSRMIYFDSTSSRLTIRKDRTEVIFTVGSVVYTVNGEARIISVAPKMLDGEVMVPSRPIADAFGVETGWNPSTQVALFIY